MAKLTQKKINWKIKQKENRVSSSVIARIINITPRYVNMIYRKYKHYKRMHMSLYEDRIITPAMAYEMKKLKKGEVSE